MLYALLSNDPKVGSFEDQRAAMYADVDRETVIERAPQERAKTFVRSLREGDTLLMAHARVLGRARERERWLDDFAARGIAVKLPGSEPVIYDEPAKKAAFHAEAVRRTGRPSRKQKTVMGRPTKYPISKDHHRIISGWWHDLMPAKPGETPKRMKAETVYRLASDLVRLKVKRHHIKYWCGNVRGGERKPWREK